MMIYRPRAALNACTQCMTIAPFGYVNHPGTMIASNLLGAIVTSIVGDDHLSTDAQGVQCQECLIDTISRPSWPHSGTA